MSEIVKKELPDGWEIRDLEDVLQVIRGISFKSSEKLHESGKNTVVCLRTANVQESVDWSNLWWVPENFVKRDEQFIREHDILMSNANSYELVGKVSLVRGVPEKATLGAFITMLRARDDVNPRFCFYQLRSSRVVEEIRSRASTTTNISNVSTGKLKDIPLWVAPLDQQKRIVAKIEELFSHIDAGIKALKKAKQLLKQYRQSVLKAAVTGELTKEWREANKAKLEPATQLLEKIEVERNAWIEEQIAEDNSEAKRLKNKLKKHVFEELDDSLVPDGWVSVSLTKLCLLVVDCHNKTAPYVESGIPLIRTSNIRDGVINFKEKMKFVNQLTYEYWSRRCPPEPGDILFTREAPMGESAIIPENTEVCMGQRMMLLRVIHDLVDIEYLHIALMDPLFQKRVQGFKVGVGVQHLRVGDVEKAVVALPSLPEQKELVRMATERLDAITRLEDEIDHQLIKSEKNKQSILASSFSGEL